MSIITTVRCRHMKRSIDFYTRVLDFECVEDGGDADPTVSVLMRGGSLLLISSHGGGGGVAEGDLRPTDRGGSFFFEVRAGGPENARDPRPPPGGQEGHTPSS